jgi:N-acetyl-alpha-D-glucosaminyl L-malate synthase BshA
MVVTLHGTDVTALGPHPSLSAVTCAALDACAGLTTPSRYLRNQAVDAFGLAAGRIEVIANFVDLERFRPPARRDPAQLARLFDAPPAEGGGGPVLFHVSNFRPIKRPLDLILALVRIRRTLPARLVLIGDGPERAAVESLAHELGVSGAVASLGRRRDFADLLGHADGFLLTSESESFGVAALEAMSCGVPVLAYRVGGLSEVVTEDVGRLVDPHDVDGLAAEAVTLLTNDGLRASLGTAARARACSRFGRKAAIDRYEAHYRRLMSAAPREAV